MKKAITAYVLSASAALAHGGHEAALVQGEAHWLTAPDHLAVLVLAGLLVGGVLAGALRARRSRSMRERRHV